MYKHATTAHQQQQRRPHATVIMRTTHQLKINGEVVDAGSEVLVRFDMIRVLPISNEGEDIVTIVDNLVEAILLSVRVSGRVDPGLPVVCKIGSEDCRVISSEYGIAMETPNTVDVTIMLVAVSAGTVTAVLVNSLVAPVRDLVGVGSTVYVIIKLGSEDCGVIS